MKRFIITPNQYSSSSLSSCVIVFPLTLNALSHLSIPLFLSVFPGSFHLKPAINFPPITGAEFRNYVDTKWKLRKSLYVEQPPPPPPNPEYFLNTPTRVIQLDLRFNVIAGMRLIMRFLLQCCKALPMLFGFVLAFVVLWTFIFMFSLF